MPRGLALLGGRSQVLVAAAPAAPPSPERPLLATDGLLEGSREGNRLPALVEDRESEAFTLGNIGGVHYLLGEFRRAIDYYRRSLAIGRELRLKPSQSQDLGNLALCHLWLDETGKALELLEQALSLAREAGLKKEEADWLKVRGSCLVKLGSYSDALANYRAALAIYKESKMKRELVEAGVDMGQHRRQRLGAAPVGPTDLRHAQTRDQLDVGVQTQLLFRDASSKGRVASCATGHDPDGQHPRGGRHSQHPGPHLAYPCAGLSCLGS